jgi:predicted ATP-dependent endonuclease of OLD family
MAIAEIRRSLQAFDEITADLHRVGLSDEAYNLKEELRPIVECDPSKFRLTAIGKQNSGKSTLLNVLCSFFKDEKFKTSDYIVTRKNEEYFDKGSNTIFVDTPGLDANQEDDREANRSLKTGVVLFLHSCRTGELDSLECKSLQRLVQEFDQPQRQIAVLCSQTGGTGNGVKEVLDRVRAQAREIVGNEVTVIAMDSIEYKYGRLENDERLIRHSHIPEVEAWIEKARKVLNKLETNSGPDGQKCCLRLRER